MSEISMDVGKNSDDDDYEEEFTSVRVFTRLNLNDKHFRAIDDNFDKVSVRLESMEDEMKSVIKSTKELNSKHSDVVYNLENQLSAADFQISSLKIELEGMKEEAAKAVIKINELEQLCLSVSVRNTVINNDAINIDTMCEEPMIDIVLEVPNIRGTKTPKRRKEVAKRQTNRSNMDAKLIHSAVREAKVRAGKCCNLVISGLDLTVIDKDNSMKKVIDSFLVQYNITDKYSHVKNIMSRSKQSTIDKVIIAVDSAIIRDSILRVTKPLLRGTSIYLNMDLTENEQQIDYELRQKLKKLKSEVLPSELDKTFLYVRDHSIYKGTIGTEGRIKVFSVY
jgi:hypothetical protein